MIYKDTLSSAVDYARNGKLEEWIHTFLLSDGQNKAFSDGLRMLPRHYLGPVRMPLSLFERCCGPEDTMKWKVSRDGFEKRVCALEEIISGENDLPPLIVNYGKGGFEVNDGNHRLEACLRLGIREYPVIIWITEAEDCAAFSGLYSEYLERGRLL